MPRGRASRRVKTTLDDFSARVTITREIEAAYAICKSVYCGGQCSCSKKQCAPCHQMIDAAMQAKRILVQTSE